MKEDTVDFHYQIVKGRVAEAIIEELFVSCGYEVHRFGMENMMPNLVRKLTDIRSPISRQIKKMPDFIVQKTDSVFFVEVKYRNDGRFDKMKLQQYGQEFPYDDCHIVLVSPSGIKCLTVKELLEGRKIDKTCDNHLCSHQDFDLDSAIVDDYIKIVRAFFGSGLKAKFCELE